MTAMKKLLCAALALTSALSLAACGQSGSTASSQGEGEGVTYKIGISQYGEHASLDNCREGFLEGLRQAGLVEDENLQVLYENAHFDDDMTTQIGETFSAADVDLMVGIATPSAVACYNAAEDKDIPVIFTAITDPVGAHLDSGNITGTSDVLPVEGQLQLIRACSPMPRPSASSTPPASPTPSTPWASMRRRLRTTASPSTPWAWPPRRRSPRRWTPCCPGAWTACPT